MGAILIPGTNEHTYQSDKPPVVDQLKAHEAARNLDAFALREFLILIDSPAATYSDDFVLAMCHNMRLKLLHGVTDAMRRDSEHWLRQRGHTPIQKD